MGTPHSPKLQHLLDIDIRLLSVISKTLVRQGDSCRSAERQSVCPAAPANWLIFCVLHSQLNFFLNRYTRAIHKSVRKRHAENEDVKLFRA